MRHQENSIKKLLLVSQGKKLINKLKLADDPREGLLRLYLERRMDGEPGDVPLFEFERDFALTRNLEKGLYEMLPAVYMTRLFHSQTTLMTMSLHLPRRWRSTWMMLHTGGHISASGNSIDVELRDPSLHIKDVMKAMVKSFEAFGVVPRIDTEPFHMSCTLFANSAEEKTFGSGEPSSLLDLLDMGVPIEDIVA